MSDRVVVATWSEFGRRAAENASAGTDHGTAAPIILFGDPIAGGLYGQAPDLAKIDPRGNLGYEVDFRCIYQEILGSHLGVDERAIFSESFERLPFIKKA